MPVDFSDFRESYSRQVDAAISFSRRRHEFFLRAKARHLIELVARRLGDPAQVEALDVGCGVGMMARLLGHRFKRLVGVDVPVSVVREAAVKVADARFATFDGAVLPLPDGAFDLAFAVCVVHHVPVPDRQALLAEMARTVRLGGLVVLLEHNPYNPLTRRAVSHCAFDQDAALLTAATAGRLLSGAGLQEVEQRYILFFPWEGPRWQGLERQLAWLPLGAQYGVSGVVRR